MVVPITGTLMLNPIARRRCVRWWRPETLNCTAVFPGVESICRNCHNDEISSYPH